MILLGIDYGLQKVGLAVLDTAHGLAEPLTIIRPNEVIDWIRKNRFNYPVDRIVIGLPGNALDKAILSLVDRIRTELELPVHYFDETLSTQDAQSNLRVGLASRKKIKKVEDAVAAAIMLQSYIEGGMND